MALSPDDLAVMVDRLRRERAGAEAEGAFDVALFGLSGGPDTDVARRYADAGATWWLESLSPMRGPLDELQALVEAGPPYPIGRVGPAEGL